MNGSSFSICVHILTLLSHFRGENLSSEFISCSININPAMVRKEISKLKKAGLVESKEGKAGGSQIARRADQITMKDILQAVMETGSHLLNVYKNQPNPKCLIGSQIQDRLDRLYLEVDDEVFKKLEQVSLEEFHHQFT